MRPYIRLLIVLTATLWLVSPRAPAAGSAVWHWRVSDATPAQAEGRIDRVPGLIGPALRADGLTTIVKVPAKDLPSLERGFTIEAWFAPQEYSWHWSALINQGETGRDGFFLGNTGDTHKPDS